MENHDEKNGVKDRILDDLGKSIKLIQRYAVCGYEGVVVIGNDSWLAQSLCHLLDLILRHGLRDQNRGYWPIVRELSHCDTLQIIQSLKCVCTSLGKGRAWLYHTLTEGSLQSYLHCICHDLKIVHRYYVTQALLRDTSRTQQLFTLLAGLEHVQFNLDPDVAYLDMAAYQQQHSEVSTDLLPSCGDPSRMTSSITSSLASPVDSGVALLDSDADATSVSEATINETDTLSLRDDKEDDSTFNEIEDNRINHQLQCLEASVGKKHLEDCNTSDAVPNSHRQNDCRHYEGCERAKDDIPAAQGVAVPDIFRSRTFSIMTASDIANQNVSEDISMLSHNATPASCFVESKNRLNILEDEKGQKNAECNAKKSDSEDIVYRRQRSKKKRSNAVDGSSGADAAARVKRVSFHEDFVNNEVDINKKCQPGGSEFSVSFLPPNSVIKRDAVKGRYSWCGEGDAPFVRRKNESDTKSDVYLSSSSTLTSSSNETVCLDHSNKKVTSKSHSRGRFANAETSQAPPVAERGTPEGQEDPPNSGSNLYLHSDINRKPSDTGILPEAMQRLSGSLKMFPSFASSVDWSSDNESIPASDTEFVCSRTGHLISSFKENSFLEKFTGSSSLVDIHTSKRKNQHRNPLGLLPSKDVASKTSLFNRFMKSITERKFVKRKPKVVLRPSRSLYIPGSRKLNQAEIMENFTMELDANMKVAGSTTHNVNELEKTFQSQVFLDSKEVLYKVFKVRSSYSSDGIGRPLLALLTNVNFYLTGVKSNYTYWNHVVLPYTQLDGMLIGPNYQTILIVSTVRPTQFLIVTGNRAVTAELVGYTEMAMRRAPTKPSLPTVHVLELDDMRALQQGLAQHLSLLEDEAFYHYSVVHLQDDHISPPTTPMGPTKEGHLMFRPATDTPLQPWEPGFFMLKAGVVYMFGDKSHRLPKRVIPLRGNGCRGCRRIPHDLRPHTFEILLGPRRSFQFAAADEYEASDWLQAFVQAASGVYEEEAVSVVPCSLVVTEQHLVTCQENFPTPCSPGSRDVRILSCAAIQDLTSFTMDRDWCILEFACREVHENSGDWVLYFTSPDEMCSFKFMLQQLWFSLQQTDFPQCPVMDDSLGRRCAETSSLLKESWNVLLDSQASS